MGQICPCCNRHKNNHLKILTDINNLNLQPLYSPPNYPPPNYSPPRYSSPKKNNIIQFKLLDTAIF